MRDLHFTTTELIGMPTAEPAEILRTLRVYADRRNFIKGVEIVQVIERASPPTTQADLEEMVQIAGQGIINARSHKDAENPHYPKYPDMVTAVQSGYAQVLGYAGEKLAEIAK